MASFITITSIAEDFVLNAIEAGSDLQITGTSDPGSLVTVRIGTAGPWTGTTDASGDWTVAVPAADVASLTPDGDFTVTAETDALFAPETLTVDTRVTTPTLTIPDTTIGDAEKRTVAFTVAGLDDDVVSATATFSDGVTDVVVDVLSGGAGAYAADLSTLTDGPISSVLAIEDDAGNPGSTVGDQIDLDTTVATPTLTISDTTIGNAEKTAVAFTVSGIDGDVADADAKVSFQDINFIKVTVRASAGVADLSTLADGPITSLLEVTDDAGNVAPAAGAEIDLDTTVATPTLTISDTTIGNAGKTAVAFTVSGLDGDVADADAKVSFQDIHLTTVTVRASAGVADLSTLADGPITSLLEVTDHAGNVASAAGAEIDLDTTAPDTPTVALANDTGADGTDRITRDGGLDVSAAAAGVTRSFSVNGGDASSSYVAPTADGSHTVVVTDTDPAGNSATASLTFTLDTTIATPTLALTNDTGASASDRITQDGSLSASPPADDVTWTVSVDGGDAASDYIAPTTDGSHTVVLVDTDTAGNSASASITFTIDTTAPDAPTVALANDTGADGTDRITRDGALDVSALAAGVTRSFSVNGGDAASDYIAPTTDGSHTVVVTDTDTAGNSATARLTFTLDTTIATPTLALTNDTGASASDRITQDGSLSASPAADDVAWTFSVDGGDAASAYIAPTTDGSHTVVLVDTDTAGNSASASITFTIDTTAPTVAVTLADSALKVGETATVTFAFSEAPSDFSLDDVIWDASTGTLSGLAADLDADADGKVWTATFTPAVNVTDTNNVITVGTGWTDAAGNPPAASSSSPNFTIDTAPPATPTLTSISQDTGVPGDFITRDRTLVLNGGADADSTVTLAYTGALSSGGTAAGTVAVSRPSGDTWRANHTATPLADGAYTFTVTSTDAFGNASSATRVVTIDNTTVAPTVTGIRCDSGAKADRITNDTTPEIFGTAEAFSTVKVFINGTLVGQAGADRGGNWSLTAEDYADFFATPLADGSYAVKLIATDLPGNSRLSASPPFTFTVDTTPPEAPTIDLATASDTGWSDTDNVINDAHATFTGTAEAGTTVELFVDGTATGFTTTAASDRTWSLTSNWEPPFGDHSFDGKHTLTVVATDAASNSSTSDGLVVTLDTQIAKPTIELAAGSDSAHVGDNVTNVASPTLSGTTDVGTQVEVFDGGESLGFAAVDGHGHWGWDLAQAKGARVGAGLSDGKHTLTVVATDEAGNTATSAELVVTVDTQIEAPTIGLAVGSDTGSSPADNLTNNDSPTLTGTAEAGGTVEVFDGGESLGVARVDAHGGWDLGKAKGLRLSDGKHTLTVVATDEPGNTATSAELVVTVDTQIVKPTIELAAESDSGDVGDNVTNDTTPTLTGWAEAGGIVVVLDGTEEVGRTTVEADGRWSHHFHKVEIQGKHSFTAVAADAAGNTSVASEALVVTVDTEGPTAPTLDFITQDTGLAGDDFVTRDRTLTLSGEGDEDSSVTVGHVVALGHDRTASGTLAVTQASGAWSADTASLADGVYTFTVTATDGTGNTSSTEEVITVDNAISAPVVTGISSFFDVFTVLSFTNDTTPNADSFFDVFTELSFTNDTTPTIFGAGDADSFFDVFVDDVWVGETLADSNGAWSLIYPETETPLDEGLHTVTAVATDVAGNVRFAEADFAFEVDATRPTQTVTIDAIAGDNHIDLTEARGELTVTGTVSAVLGQGEKVHVTVGGATYEPPVDGLSWTVSVPRDAASGLATGRVTACVVDAAGNAGPPASQDFTVEVDTTAPAAPVIHSQTTNDTTPTVGGTAEVGSTVTLYAADGTTILGPATTAATDGSWSITVASPLPAAAVDFFLKVRATDRSGNVSDFGTGTLVVDTTVAAAVVKTKTKSNQSNDRIITNDGTLEVSGEAGATFQYSADPDPQPDGFSWGASPPALVEGANSVWVRQIDLAGNVSQATNLQFTLDTLRPEAPGVALDTDTGVVGDGITSIASLNFSKIEFGAKVEYSPDPSVDGFSWGATNPAVVVGANSVWVRQIDGAGNVSEATNFQFTLDRESPSRPGVGLLTDTGAPGDGISSIATLNFSKIEFDAKVEVSKGPIDIPIESWSWGESNFGSGGGGGSGAEGRNSVWVRQTDKAGNVSDITTFEFTLDSVAPDAPVINALTTTDTTPTVTGKAELGSTVTLSEGGAVLGTAAATDGTWSITVADAQAFAVGKHIFKATVEDLAGNVSVEGSGTVVVDAAPPLVGATITGTSLADWIHGTASPELRSTEAGDTINGLDGKDTISALGGNDTIRGGLGADFIQAGAGDDVIQIGGSEGLGDGIRGGEAGETTGDVLQVLGTDAVTLSGFNASSAEIEIWQGNQQALLGTGVGNIFDLSGLVDVTGLRGVDGGAGNDTLIGTRFADVLNGSSGNDVVTGGLGDDRLTGGADNDTFVFRADFGHDVITDFSAGALVVDVIQFDPAIFADFAAVISGSSLDVNGNVVITDASGNSVTLEGVTSVANLHANDFSFI